MAPTDYDPRDDYDDRPDGPAERRQANPRKTPPARPNPWVQGVVLGIVLGLFGMCIAPVFTGGFGFQEAAHRIRSTNNLKEIGLAIHNYNDWHGERPHNSYAPDGKPLLSWRVHILPFVEEEALYSRFRLDEPWDSPANRQLLREMPRVYARPMDKPEKRGIKTHYRGFSSSGAVFERRPGDVPSQCVRFLGRTVYPENPFRLDLLQDGSSNTILVVEAWDPVEWTKPDDLDASPAQPFPKMGGFRWKNNFQAVLADGAVRQLKLDTPEATLRALVTHSGNEPLPAGWDQ
jgi:Protein of unknown function (DUF1559)